MLFAHGTPYYLDAGTGSMLVQMVVAGAAGVAVFLKMFWSKITSPFRRKRTEPAEPAEPAETEPVDAQAPRRADD